ncbi:2-isopropylmalate synthase [Endomicrobiia bacterium]|nr:2-isopropylmalate synthase [Endomicrobiia bacterium]GHT10953.1 2-isopropylmalate synthase [Endomicrobiia bacterium]GHT19416.1 2-isopropylmalate synthase [Endomicrobiia bacterium]GHT25866.1 2-isopropylmalate synthase [Endomicrobiia bacterium]GHT31551.1 2-isopropylmalate synthase [Endomicrobiia bacterium]
MEKDTIIFFDTTLRDGEQSPGASMNLKEKLLVANQLAALGVDVIEAGFPISSQGDFEAVKTISQQIKTSSIAGLCRASEKDITTCWNAVKYAKKPRIHIFLATSDLHIEKKLQKTRAQILDMAVKTIKYGKSLCKDVEFSAEDAGRSDMDFLCKVVEAVIDAGATTVNIPDTVGYTTPIEFGNKIAEIKRRVPNVNKAIISVHCHNDLGLAVANSLSAIENGARQIECTINGIGERAGNTSLEEIAMTLKVRHHYYNVKHTLKTNELYNTSKLVSRLTGILVQVNKAVVGANAFAHESGIHQDGVLKARETYEIMSPADVGVPESLLVLGKHSGRHAFFKRIKDLGYKLDEKTLEHLFEKFKILADKKKTVFDDDIIALIEEDTSSGKETFILNYLSATSGTGTIPTATVKISKSEGNKKIKSITLQAAACGSGPVDATYKAIDKIINMDIKLTDFSLRSVSSGEDALGEVVLKAEYKGTIYSGKGTSTDIIEASAKAYIQAINKAKLFYDNKKGK